MGGSGIHQAAGSPGGVLAPLRSNKRSFGMPAEPAPGRTRRSSEHPGWEPARFPPEGGFGRTPARLTTLISAEIQRGFQGGPRQPPVKTAGSVTKGGNL